MSWHGFAEAFAPPALTQETLSAVQRVISERQVPDAGLSALTALASGRWLSIRCDNLVSGRRCGTYLGEAVCFGSAQIVARCRRPCCKDRRTCVFVGQVPTESELPIVGYAGLSAT